MPLRDHFRSPVNDKHRWDAVHGQWPAELVRTLFDLVPEGYQLEPKIHLGSPFEVDVSTYTGFENGSTGMWESGGSGGTATLEVAAPTFTVETDLIEPAEYSVRVYDIECERKLVAAIEIVSPSNKDRPETREKFVHKIIDLLQQDVYVSIVDLVIIRRANFYAELLASLVRSDPKMPSIPPHTYCVSLRLREQERRGPLLDAWFCPMNIGDVLPTIPIWLNLDTQIWLPLEPSYEETCRLLRIV